VKNIAPLACKTDSVDARVLAELCRRDLVPAVWVPLLEERALRERLRRRLHLVRLRSSAKNRIFGLLTQWGLRLSLARLRQPDGLELLAARGVHGAWRRSVGEALAVIDLLDERIAPLDAELSPLARADGRVELLDTIPGIGTLLGLTIATEIGQVARFASPRKLIGYAGLAPKVHQSGDSSRSGELSKAGSRVLRWAAVEAAQGAWRETTPGTASTATSSAATPASRIRPRPSSPARSLSPAGTCSAATSHSNHRRAMSEPMRPVQCGHGR
jgi:transposase